MITPVSF